LIGLGIGHNPMPTKLQVVVFVQGIVPSSFTHESSLRCYGLFGIGWKIYIRLVVWFY